MGSDGYYMNYRDVDVRLPPRKRLLAVLKRQSCSESNSSPSLSLSLSSGVSVDQCPPSEFDVRLNNLLRSYKNGSKMSPEEIALAAKSAAEAAAKAAKVARAAAEEKAAIAAKAAAAAKSALDLVAYEETSNRYGKKNELKKHAECQPFEKCGDDEELARRLHRAMNSSRRISNNSPGSKSKDHKHKKLKIHSPNDKSGVTDGTSMREGSNEAESSYPIEKSFEGFGDSSMNGRIGKRGKIEQKKLPLSICSSRDQANPEEELNLTNSLLTGGRVDNPTIRQLSLFSEEPSVDNVTPMEVTQARKCQDFKATESIKKDNPVQS